MRVTQADCNDTSTWWYVRLLGRKVKEITPLGKVETYEYDKKGNIVSVTNKHGNTTHYNYDKESRLTSVEYPSGSTMN